MGIRRAMSSAPFRRLLAAQTVSRWGDTFNSVALVVLVYRLTGSGLGVAVVVALEIAPVLLFGFLAGAVVDRLPRRRVMIGADLGRAGVALALAALHRHLAAVYLAAFALAALSTFFAPAVASALPSIVDRDDLVGANSALWSAAVVSQIVLAPAAGALVSLAGPAPAFLLNAASFAVSALLLTRLTLPPHRGGRLGSRWQEAAAGLRTVAGDRLLGTLALTQVLAALSAGATSALLVVLAADHLRVGPGRFGLLLAAIGVGAGLGPLVAQRLVVDVRQPRWLFGPYLLRGVVDLLLAGVRSFPVAAGALTAYGVGTSTGMVAYTRSSRRPSSTRSGGGSSRSTTCCGRGAG